ncbi:MAG TPA: M36 family metallopeptidase [Actinomycetota bacterium]
MRRATATLIFALTIGLANIAIPLGGASTDEPQPPVGIAIDWVRSHTAGLGVSAADVSELTVTDAYESAHTGVNHVYLRQRIAGLDVAGSSITVNILPGGRVFHVGSRLVPNLAAASGKLVLTAAQATTAAAKALDAGAARNTSTKLVYQAMNDGRIRLAWNVEIEERSGLHWWNASIDAATGKLLTRFDMVDHDNVAAVAGAIAHRGRTRGPIATQSSPDAVPDGSSYRVYALPFESPNDGDRTLVNTPADAQASPFGWHDTNGAAGAESTRTVGNNVHAYLDTTNTNAAQPGMDADGGTGLDFDFPAPLQAPPPVYRDAAITNLFYWNNVIHDVIYRYGFDEASGNFQVNNYERGGLGNDSVQAEAQDGSGVNNANFGTPVEGNRPRMQMYVWSPSTGGDPNLGIVRDGDFESGIIAHEWSHGLSNRLTGGPTVSGCLSHAEREGEGWSDWVALALTTLSTENGATGRGMGPYVLGQPNRQGAGIRPTRYSTNMAINPSTYNTIKTSAVPHGVGYVWATMLWEVYWDLIAKYGFNPNVYGDWTTGGNNLAIQLVVDGMKLQPCSPGFVDARNAILAADVALTQGENQCLIWRGFSKRGLGYGAKQGSVTSVTDGTQAFNTHPDCQPHAVATPESLSASVSPGGSTDATLAIGNGALVDGQSLSWTIAEAETDCSAPSDLAWLSASPADGTTAAAGTTDVTVALDGSGLGAGDSHTGVLCIASNDTGTPVLAVPVTLTAE